MSAIFLLAAGHSLPLYDPGLRRCGTSRQGGQTRTTETDGFSVQEHFYYRDAVEVLGLEMQPFRYELNLAPTAGDASEFRRYLAAHCVPGKQVELWHLWVGEDRTASVPRFRGPLAALDQETLEQLCRPPRQGDCPGQCLLTVII